MEEFEFIDKALFFREKKILVIADLHIGFEEALNQQGVYFPRQQFEKIKKDLEEIFSFVGKLKEIIILGDLKHEFGKVLEQEWRETLELIDFLKKKAGKIVLIKGNHDNYLISVAKNKGIELKEFYIEEGICFIHGNKARGGCLDRKIKMIVLGHRHPAITIRKEAKSERYKCFLVGKWRGKEIVILPSFFPLIEGSDVFLDDAGLAFNFKLKEFDVFIVGDEGKVYGFGKVKDVGRLS